MTRDDALGALEKTLALASAETATVSLSGQTEGATRYANNGITQNVSSDRLVLRVTAAFGQRTGTATTNQLDPDSIAATVRRAEEAARASDPDLEYLPPLGPQTYPVVSAASPSTAAAGPAERARIVSVLTAAPRAAGYRAAGSVTITEGFEAIATSNGLRAHHTFTNARVLCTVIADGASGWAGQGSFDLSRVPVDEIGERACRKAEAAREPQEFTPGPTTVVLEPQATADLLEYLIYEMDAKAADEGRSAFTGKQGQDIVGANVSLKSCPAHGEVPGSPFLPDGAPAEDVTWFEDGKLVNLRTTRFWAQKTGRPRVGFPGNIIMAGGGASSEELISRVEDGLLVTRFWYIRSVNPMKLLLTGMTRDGLYRIVNGKVAGPVLNMRFNESPVRMLANVAEIGASVPTREEVYAPTLLAKDFQFSSVTRF